jgi:putative aldouronate transport system substrate-binding protein
MKRSLIFAIVLVASAGMLFAGGEGESSAAAGSYQLNEPGKWPVVLGGDMYEFDAVAYYNATEANGLLNEAPFTRYLEEETNVKVNFVEIIESGVWAERQNLMLASGDLPDVIMSPSSMSAQQLYTYGLNGTFVSLNKYIDERMPDLKKELEKWPKYKAQLTMPDGNIYAFPYLEAGCYHCTMSNKFFIYKPWVEKLGLKWPPETTDDLYKMLVAFRDRDPNGNGQKDEIPLMAATNGWNTTMTFLYNSFIYTQPGSYLVRENGKVSFVANTNEWRAALTYLSKLVKEGLLAPESFVQNNDQLRALVESPDAPKVGAVPAGWFGVFTVNGGGTGRFADYWPIAPLKGPNGVQFSQFNQQAVVYHTKVTRVADRPDIIAQWANWFYQDTLEHTALSWDYDLEGVNWRYLTEEEKKMGYVSRDGSPALTLPLTTKTYGLGADKRDDGWTRAAMRWDTQAFGGLPLEWKDDRSKQEYWLMVWTRDLMQPYHPGERYMPPNLVFDESIQDEMTDLTAAVVSGTGVVQQWSTEFIVGRRDISSDAEWQAYLRELDRAGVKRFVELWQQTLTKAGY